MAVALGRSGDVLPFKTKRCPPEAVLSDTPVMHAFVAGVRGACREAFGVHECNYRRAGIIMIYFASFGTRISDSYDDLAYCYFYMYCLYLLDGLYP